MSQHGVWCCFSCAIGGFVCCDHANNVKAYLFSFPPLVLSSLGKWLDLLLPASEAKYTL